MTNDFQAISDELEAGIARAQTESAWYSFIALDDVREALKVAARAQVSA